MKGRLLANHTKLHPSSVHHFPIRKASPCPSKALIVKSRTCDASLRPLAVTNDSFLVPLTWPSLSRARDSEM
eukprot:6084440-Lingulodinium_polyedra.AAC.1